MTCSLLAGSLRFRNDVERKDEALAHAVGIARGGFESPLLERFHDLLFRGGVRPPGSSLVNVHRLNVPRKKSVYFRYSRSEFGECIWEKRELVISPSLPTMPWSRRESSARSAPAVFQC